MIKYFEHEINQNILRFIYAFKIIVIRKILIFSANNFFYIQVNQILKILFLIKASYNFIYARSLILKCFIDVAKLVEKNVSQSIHINLDFNKS